MNTSLEIEDQRLPDLRPYARNARRHSKAQIKQIADSIRRFGFTNPVLVSDANEIIAGHGRVQYGEPGRASSHSVAPHARNTTRPEASAITVRSAR